MAVLFYAGQKVWFMAQQVIQSDLTDDRDSAAIRQLTDEWVGFSADGVKNIIPPTHVSKYQNIIIDFTNMNGSTIQLAFSQDGFSSWNIYKTVGVGVLQIIPVQGEYFKADVIAYNGTPITARMMLKAIQVNPAIDRVDFPIPKFATLAGVQDSTANLRALRTADTTKSAAATISGSTAVWTPSGKKFRLMGYIITVTGDVSKASAGNLQIKLLDGALDLGISYDIFVPSNPATTFSPGFSTGFVNLGNGRLSAEHNTALNVGLSATLTTGRVTVNAVGIEEA